MGRVFATAGGAIRQWRHPPEFRIKASAWPAGALADLARAMTAQGGAPARTDDVQPHGGVPELSDGSLADLATSLWRLRTRIERMDDPPRPVVRHLETAWDVLTGTGITIKDHVGEPFDPGLAMSVVAYEPTPGLAREQITEAVRPGVYLEGRTIQMAEVIVGTPEATAAGATEEARGR
ncbi:nucleotide exchange factor GrpE [Spirillospora sp. NBC_00431]